MFKILDTLLKPYHDAPKLKKSIEDEINNHILYSLIWSLGAVLEEESRKKFSHYISN